MGKNIWIHRVNMILPFENPKISTLLTSYNNPTGLERAIQSVLNQTYQNFEIILLDDNSDDPKVLEILEKYKKHPKIKFYNSNIKEEDRLKESPCARQINVGLKMATGKLITYMCDDVEYLPHKLETMVKFLKRHPFVKVCYNQQKWIKERTGEIVRILKPDRILRDPFRKVDHNSVMHYKSCIDKVGNWDTISLGMPDAFFWRKLGKEYPFYPIKEVLEIHYRDEKCFSNKVKELWEKQKN
jgi:spore maturation protein CgeD